MMISSPMKTRPKVSSIRKATRKLLKWNRYLDKIGYDNRPSATSKAHTRIWRHEATLKIKKQYADMGRGH